MNSYLTLLLLITLSCSNHDGSINKYGGVVNGRYVFSGKEYDKKTGKKLYDFSKDRDAFTLFNQVKISNERNPYTETYYVDDSVDSLKIKVFPGAIFYFTGFAWSSKIGFDVKYTDKRGRKIDRKIDWDFLTGLKRLEVGECKNNYVIFRNIDFKKKGGFDLAVWFLPPLKKQ